MSTDAARDEKYDSDPEAIEWARTRIQHLIDRMDKFEKQAQERGSDPERWRMIANLLRSELLGSGTGCVIAAFDTRLPAFAPAIARAMARQTPVQQDGSQS